MRLKVTQSNVITYKAVINASGNTWRAVQLFGCKAAHELSQLAHSEAWRVALLRLLRRLPSVVLCGPHLVLDGEVAGIQLDGTSS